MDHRINITGRPDLIENILTGLDDPKTWDVDFIDDEDEEHDEVDFESHLFEDLPLPDDNEVVRPYFDENGATFEKYVANIEENETEDDLELEFNSRIFDNMRLYIY